MRCCGLCGALAPYRLKSEFLGRHAEQLKGCNREGVLLELIEDTHLCCFCPLRTVEVVAREVHFSFHDLCRDLAINYLLDRVAEEYRLLFPDPV
jgi:hypothetical protein